MSRRGKNAGKRVFFAGFRVAICIPTAQASATIPGMWHQLNDSFGLFRRPSSLGPILSTL